METLQPQFPANAGKFVWTKMVKELPSIIKRSMRCRGSGIDYQGHTKTLGNPESNIVVIPGTENSLKSRNFVYEFNIVANATILPLGVRLQLTLPCRHAIFGYSSRQMVGTPLAPSLSP